MSSQKPQYRFYATLLNSFSYYLSSDSDAAFQEFIDKLNRVPFTSESIEKGTSFNILIDSVINNGYEYIGEKSGSGIKEVTVFDGFNFPTDIIHQFINNLSGAISQVRTSTLFQTNYGLIEVYGVIDDVLPANMMVDIKTTGSWNFPKFLNAWQHIVYPYCFYEKYGLIYDFSYMVTDFRSVTTETYQFNPQRDIPKLRNHCEQLIEFIEAHRDLITDTKLFTGDTINGQDIIIIEEAK